MQVADALNAQIAFTLFDAWMNAVHSRQHHQCKGNIASPLLDAAFKAFDAYAATKETEFAAMASSITSQMGAEVSPAQSSPLSYSTTYNHAGIASTKDLAPFLALNLMA
jgi:hypothetical protein